MVMGEMERKRRVVRLWPMIEDHVTVAESGFVGSFEQFYTETWPLVYRALVVATSDHDLAREAVDEAMVRAYERWRTVAAMDNRAGWVYRVASNWATSRLRRRKLIFRQPRVDTTSHDPDLVDPRLLDAVRQLSPRHRDVVVARYLLDLSEAATAEALGIPVGTVKSRLSRALSQLKEVLS
jgi:RNA polymerase sigma-70 factor (ECF subfamily)